MSPSPAYKSASRRAFIDTLPVLIGYLFLGIGFGVMLHHAGFGLPWAIGMSVLMYSGSMQYLAIDLLSGGVSLLSAGLTTLMVNIRHLFYGLSVVELYRPYKAAKPYMLFALTDENYSIICGRPAPREVDAHSYYFYVTLFDHSYWILGSAIGSLLGSVLPFNAEGIDFALPALFITIFVDQWTSTKQHSSPILGMVVALLFLLIFGAERFLIPTMLTISALLLFFHRDEIKTPQKEMEVSAYDDASERDRTDD